EGALPIVATVEHDEQPTGLDAAKGVVAIFGALGEAEPQHVYRRAEILNLEPGKVAHRGMAPVGTDDEVDLHPQRALRNLSHHAGDSVVLPQEVSDLRLHAEIEARIA